MRPPQTLESIRLVPFGVLELPYIPREEDAARFPLVPFEPLHSTLFASLEFKGLRRVRLYLGARSSAEDRLEERWRFRTAWAFLSRVAACTYMQREEYRAGLLVHVVEMPALLAETDREGLLITNLGWEERSAAEVLTIGQADLRGLLKRILADSALMTASGLRRAPHQALLHHLLSRNQLQGWAVPEGLSAAWTEDPGVGDAFNYQVLSRTYHRLGPVDSTARPGTKAGLQRWQWLSFEPFPEGKGLYG